MSDINWYDMLATEEDRLLDLSLEEWTVERAALMEARPDFATRIDRIRRDLWYARKDKRHARNGIVEPPQFGFYRDVADEPWKYGDDAYEQWLVLDRELPLRPGRWRINAYWTWRREQETREEHEAKVFVATQLQALVRSRQIRKRLDAAATKIQALVRGYRLRSSVQFMDCAECLSHRIASKLVEGRNLCQTCFDALGWHDCIHCGMPVHVDRLAEFSSCCSRECMAEVMDLYEEDDDEYRPCDGCGASVYAGDFGNYRLGYWCSRACAYG